MYSTIKVREICARACYDVVNTTIASRMVAWELSHESTIQHWGDAAVPVMKSESPAFLGLVVCFRVVDIQIQLLDVKQ
jgi:hypothetical protein